MTHARLMDGLRALTVLGAALLLALLAVLPAQAQQVGGQNIRAALVADGKPEPGKTWTVALHFTPKSDEWHGYWSNPGDAGAGMRLDWTLPEGWRAGEPLYPVPQTLTIADLMNHVFEGSYAVLVPIEVPTGSAVADGPIKLDLDYLACTDQICVPERAQLSLDPAAAMSNRRFDGWRAALAPLLDQPVRWEIAGQTLRLGIPLPTSLAVNDPHVFIATRDLVNYAAPQRFSRSGDWLVAEIPLAGEAVTTNPVAGILALGDKTGFRFEGEQGEVPASGTPLASATEIAPIFWLALVGALLGGLILNVMPCVFPILSIKAMALARAGGEERQARSDAIAYTAGVVVACLALGGVMLALRAGGEQVGWAFQLQQPGIVVALLVLAVAITANFIGLFEVPSLAIAGKGGGGGGGSFLTGLLAAFVATPCTGPFMAAALGAALLLPAPEALALFAALGLGLALPFLLLGFIPALRRLIPRPGPWMITFRRWMAVPMALTALALTWLAWRLGGPGYAAGAVGLAALFTAMLHMLWGSNRTGSGRRTAALATLATASLALLIVFPQFYAPDAARDAGLLDAEPFSEKALAEARAGGTPVFVYFTADWCLTCKVNEGAAIERAATRDAFEKAGVTVLVGDWTRRDEAITRFLTAQGAAGVPLYLWYPAGPGAPRQLPQVLTPGMLVGLANGSG